MSRRRDRPVAPSDLYYDVLCTGGCGNKLHRHHSHIMHNGDFGAVKKHGLRPSDILGGVCDPCMVLVNLFASAGVFVEDPWLTAAGKLAEFDPVRRREAEAAARLGARGDEVLTILRGER